VLVDSNCYASEERNVNPNERGSTVTRDMNYEVRYCTPKPKTRAFSLVEPDWTALNLDAAGNAEAAGLVHTAGRKPIYRVTVTGQKDKHTLKVESIRLAQ
jgi:hypothetical protein